MGKDAVLQLGRKKHRRTLDKVGGISSVIGADSKFIGTFSGDENYLIYGTVEGDCDLDGTVVVEESALWKGKILAANVIIAGEVNGDVIAKVKLELTPTAKIVGNVTGPVVAIAEGAVVEGSMHMSGQGEITHFSEKRSDKS